MVFPSRGCRTCKNRRVKCDAVQPVCGRCFKADRTCTWDPNDQAGLHFKSENAFAKGEPRRPRKGREALSEALGIVAASPTSVPETLSLPTEVRALSYWAKNFVFELHDIPLMSHEYFSYVPFYWSRARTDSSLHLALAALSQAIFGRTGRTVQVIEDADRVYSQAIIRTQKETEELSNVNIDELLLAIMLMATYENVVFARRPEIVRDSASFRVDEVGTRLWSSVCHHEGAVALLTLRRQRGFPPNIPLDTVVRRQVVRSCILRGTSVPTLIQNGAEYGEEGPSRELDAHMIQVAGLRAKSLDMFKYADGRCRLTVPELKKIAFEAQELDATLASWSRVVPDSWRFSTEPGQASVDSHGNDLHYTGPIHTYTTHGHATIWNRHRACRLITNSIRKRALSILVQHNPDCSFSVHQQGLCEANIVRMTNDICGSMPFFSKGPTGSYQMPDTGFTDAEGHLARIEGETFPQMVPLIAWVLTVAVSTEGVPEPQREWLKRRLKIAALSIHDSVLGSVIERGEFRF